MRLLFVDVDGVLNSDTFHDVYPYHGNEEFCKYNVNAFNIITDTLQDVKIVISSAWRGGRSVRDLQELFKKNGINAWDQIIDKTGYHPDDDRGQEILDWLSETKEDVEMWVAIDDFPDNLTKVKDHLMLTDYMIGLTRRNALKVIEMLQLKENKDGETKKTI